MRVLHPALWTLLRMRSASSLRRTLRAVRSFRSAAMFLLGLAVIGAVIQVILNAGMPLITLDPDRLAPLYQSGLLTFLLVGQIKTLGDRALYFSPSEADYLFPAPFTRRELIIYRVFSALGGILILSALLTLLLLSFGGWWPAVFAGALLSFLFLHQLAMCLATLREVIEAHAFSVARRILVLMVLGLVLASIAYALSASSVPPSSTAAGMPSGRTMLGVLDAAYASWTMQSLLLPFLPFAEVVTASSLQPGTLGWIAVCLLMNACAFALLLYLDARNLYASAALSRRELQQTRAARARRKRPPVRARWLPTRAALLSLARLGGAGTIAAMQLTNALRAYRLLAELALVVLFIAGVFHLSPAGGGAGGAPDVAKLIQAAAWTSVIVSNPLRFDFRAGTRELEYLKTLPLRPWIVCAGQLTTPVLITLLYQAVFLALALPVLAPAAAMGTIAVAVALNLIWYCMENLAFLLYPASQASRGLGDIQFIGRQVFMLSVKITLLALGAILAVTIGYWLATSFVFDLQQFVFVIAFVLLMEALLLFGLLARAFKRLDLGRC